MGFRLVSLFLLALTMMVPAALAESSDCTMPILVATDGRYTQSVFPAATTFWFGIPAQAGHSYSVEFLPSADNAMSPGHVLFSPVGIFGPNDGLQACRGNSSVSVTQTSGYAPVLRNNNNGTARRISFTAQSNGVYLISVGNVGVIGNYSFRAVDTTLFNPRWSTYSGYDNHWGFLNVSDMTITGVLTIYDVNGNLVTSSQFNIPAGTVKLRFSFPSDMNLPRNNAGYAMFSYNGPPDSIVADAYMANLSIIAIFPTRFERRDTR